MDEHDPCEIVSTRLIPVTRERIFAAYRDVDSLSRWWGPNGFTSTVEHFDFRPGGEWRFLFRGPDGKTYPNRCVWRDIVDPARIVLEHVSQPHFVLAMAFDEEAGGTRITWRQRFDTPEVREALAPMCVPSNEQNFDRLEAELQRS